MCDTIQQNWLTQVRKTEAVAQAPQVAIPSQQVEMSFTFTQPVTTSSVHTQPSVIIFRSPQDIV